MFVALCLPIFFFALRAEVRFLKYKDLDEYTHKDGLNLVLIKNEGSGDVEEMFKKMGEVFSGFVRFAVVEYSSGIPDAYKSFKYPSIKVFSDRGKSTFEYSKALEPQDLYDYISGRIRDITKKRFYSQGFVVPDTYVVTLGDSNFTQIVRDSNDHYLVEFFAPWCGHCKALAPEWKDAAKQLRGKIKLAAVDCTVNTQLASEFDIKGYPTIKFIPAKSKNLHKAAQDYKGGRTASAIVLWADSTVESYQPGPELIQITSQADLEQECYPRSLCVISFFPNRLDTDSKTWTKYIQVLRDVIETQKTMGYSWVWIEGAVDDKFEEALGVGGFGYPALVVLSHKKKVYSIMRSSFEVNSIKNFMVSLGSKAAITDVVSGELPTFKGAKKWDGSRFASSEL